MVLSTSSVTRESMLEYTGERNGSIQTKLDSTACEYSDIWVVLCVQDAFFQCFLLPVYFQLACPVILMCTYCCNHCYEFQKVLTTIFLWSLCHFLSQCSSQVRLSLTWVREKHFMYSSAGGLSWCLIDLCGSLVSVKANQNQMTPDHPWCCSNQSRVALWGY